MIFNAPANQNPSAPRFTRNSLDCLLLTQHLEIQRRSAMLSVKGAHPTCPCGAPWTRGRRWREHVQPEPGVSAGICRSAGVRGLFAIGQLRNPRMHYYRRHYGYRDNRGIQFARLVTFNFCCQIMIQHGEDRRETFFAIRLCLPV